MHIVNLYLLPFYVTLSNVTSDRKKEEKTFEWVTFLFWFSARSSQKALGGQIKGNDPGNMKHKLTTHQYVFNSYQRAHKCKLKWYVGSNKYAV